LLQAGKLEEEANMLRTQLVTQLYAYDDPALLHPIINTIPALVKGRASLAPLLVSSMGAWTPNAMEAARRPPMQVRSVEKTLRGVMAHIVK
jgi:symplekin